MLTAITAKKALKQDTSIHYFGQSNMSAKKLTGSNQEKVKSIVQPSFVRKWSDECGRYCYFDTNGNYISG